MPAPTFSLTPPGARHHEDSIFHDPLPDTAAVAALFDSPPTAAPLEPIPPSLPLAPSPENSDAQPVQGAAAEPIAPVRVPRQIFTPEARIPGDLAPLADLRNRTFLAALVALLLLAGDDDIHRHLQVVPRITFRDSVLPTPEEPANFASNNVCVDFGAHLRAVSVCLVSQTRKDVHENNAKYKKSAPGIPAFRVAVCPYVIPRLFSCTTSH